MLDFKLEHNIGKNEHSLNWVSITEFRIRCLSFDETILVKIQKQPPEMFFKLGVLKNFAIFTGKDLRWSQARIFIKKVPHHRCFLIKFAKFLRTRFLQKTTDG